MDGFTHLKNCIVRQRFLHVLSGYALERTSNGIYIYNFVYPLFDSSDGITLLYSFRLDACEFYISIDDLKRDDMDFLLAKKLTDLSDKNKFSDLQDFCSHCESYNGLLKNSHAKLNYGFALILAGRPEEASVVLREVSSVLRGSDFEKCNSVLGALSSSSDYAKNMILNYEKEMVARLGFNDQWSQSLRDPSE